MKYIYGPVKSRRLGLSLGITLTSYKICSFDCNYCQIGPTSEKTIQRKEYIAIEEVLNELKSWLQNNASEAGSLNYISLSGSGEPTLNIKIGELIREIKKITPIPVAVITNASLLDVPRLREALMQADLILPSLDTVTPRIFMEINRPHRELKIENIINGLLSLRRESRLKMWLEIMLIKGLNDDLRQIKKLKEVIDRINPDKIQLNSPVRLTSKLDILPVPTNKLKKIKKILGDRCQIL